MKKYLFQISIGFLLVCVIVTCWSTRAQAYPEKPKPSEIVEIVERAKKFLQDEREKLSEGSISVKKLAESLESAEQVFNWVRQNTGIAPYRGILRGPGGVLEDRVGSSADRAYLLATILEVKGYEVRLARTTLSEAQASGMLKKAQEVSAPRLSEKDDSVLESLLPYLSDLPETSRDFAKAVVENTQEKANTLLAKDRSRQSLLYRKLEDLVEPHVRLLADSELAKGYVDDLREHWWVQYRQPRTKRWHQLDLSQQAPEQVMSRRFDIVAYDRLPSSLLHRVRIALEVGFRKEGDEPLQKKIVLDKTFPAYLLEERGESIDMLFMPSPAFSDNDIQKIVEGKSIDSVLGSAVRTFAPVLVVGGEVLADQGFSYEGKVSKVDSDLLKSLLMAGSVVARANQHGLEQAAGLLADLPVSIASEKSDKQVKARQAFLAESNLIIEVLAAGRQPKRFIRNLYSERSKSPHFEALLSLLSTQRINVSVSRQSSRKYNLDYADLGIIYAGFTLKGGRKDSLSPDQSKRLTSIEPFKLEFERIRRELMSEGHHELFPVEPQLTIVSSQLLFKDGRIALRRLFDIVSNLNGSYGLVDSKRLSKAYFEQGISDTLAEASALEAATAKNINNAARLHIDSSVKLKLVGYDDPILKTLDAFQADQISQALAGGYLVVAPESTKSADEFYWWKIDPANQNILGIGPSGRGEASVDYAALFSTVLCGGTVAADVIRGARGIDGGDSLPKTVVTATLCLFGGALSLPSMTAKLGSVISLIGTGIGVMDEIAHAATDPAPTR